MNVLVSDTSVLIDLERCGLLEAAFQIGMTLVVPDLLYERELADYNGAYLQALGLGVLELTASEVELSQALQAGRTALSLADCFALVCGLRPNHILLSGDGNLRREAENRNAIVHGLLWLLDQMELAGIENPRLFESLSMLKNHQRCRLPRGEVERRLERWSM